MVLYALRRIPAAYPSPRRFHSAGHKGRFASPERFALITPMLRVGMQCQPLRTRVIGERLRPSTLRLLRSRRVDNGVALSTRC